MSNTQLQTKPLFDILHIQTYLNFGGGVTKLFHISFEIHELFPLIFIFLRFFPSVSTITNRFNDYNKEGKRRKKNM